MRVLLFSGLTVAIWAVAYFAYNQAVVRKLAIPSLGFWFTIAIVDWVALISLLAAGVHNLGLTQVAVWTAGATATCVLTWRRHGHFKLDGTEILCLVLTVVGLILWMWVGNPKVSVVIQAIAFTIATVPFWRNALNGGERWQVLPLSLCGSLASLGTVREWSVITWVPLVVPLLGVVLNAISLYTAFLGGNRLLSGTAKN